MGIPVRLTSADPALMDAVLAGYDAWTGCQPEPSAPTLHIELRSAEGPIAHARQGITTSGSRLRLRAPGVTGVADAGRRIARSTIAPELPGDRARLADAIDTLLLFILTRAGRVPLHAAGVLVGDRAILLAGPSGSGKSTLAHTAALEGLPILSDDTVYVQSEPRLRVWGFPRPIHLLPSGDGDAAATVDLRYRAGRWKRAHEPLAGWAPGNVADRAELCLLERGASVRIEPLDREEAVARMTRQLDPGFDLFREELPSVVRALAAERAWLLTLSGDAHEAIALLRARFGQAGQAPRATRSRGGE